MWESLYFVGAIVIAVCAAYGIYQSRTRNKANDRVTQAATKELYADADRYEDGGRRETLKDQLHPS